MYQAAKYLHDDVWHLNNRNAIGWSILTEGRTIVVEVKTPLRISEKRNMFKNTSLKQ